MKKKVPSIASNLFYKNLKKFIYCLLFLAPTLSFSQYDMDLFLQFNGNYDFTAIGNTLNPAPNPCNILTESSATLTLEPSQSIVSAHLYWAGSGSIDFGAEYPSDRIVFLNGNEVRNSRQFQATANFGNNSRDYFSYYANVTEFVTGNGPYTLSGFDITDNIQGSPGGPYCGSGTDFGGWSVIIIYEDPNLSLNQISLFDGYELVYGDSCCNNIEIILDGIDVASDELAKIGFLAWEGDEGIANNETLRINDVPISNAQNPINNAFNGSNSYTGSNDLFNMDLDVYDLEGIVEPDDTQVQINLTSDQDLIIINNLIISVNSELPDATIEFDPVFAICDDGGLEINYTVSNVNSTKFLPAGVNIAFYAETTTETILLDTAITNSVLAIGESESGSINLTIPIGDPGFPDIFTLKAVVDDDGTGIGNVSETNEGNNEFLQEIDLSIASVNLGEDILIDEGNAVCEGVELEIGIVPGSLGESGYQWYFINSVFVEEEIPGATESYLTITETGRYILKTTAYLGTSIECIISGDILVEFIPFSPAVEPDPIVICDDPFDDSGEFDLTIRDVQIINDQPNTSVTYYILEADAEEGNTNFIDPPNAFTSTSGTVYARLATDVGDCFSVVPLLLQVSRPIAIANPITEFFICDNDQSGDEIFNLTEKYDEIVDGLEFIDLTYYNSESEAEVPQNPILTPDNYSSGGETIWVRAESIDGCTAIGFFELVLGGTPVYQEVPLFQLCDDAIVDGFTDFDLEIQTPIIQDGDTNLIVTYHLDPLDAEAGTIPSLSSPYTNIINPESIWVRVEDPTLLCYDTFRMVLEVISVTGIVPDELFSCDEVPNDGFADFDLTFSDAQIINGQPNTFVTYYEDVVDADAGNTNFIALPTAFENTTIDTQIVFARLEETILGCYDVVELVLTVNAAPAITDPVEDYALCDNDEDLTEIFDLTSKYDEIVNTLSDITLTYYNSEASAEVPRNPIQTPDNYSSTGAEVIWFRAVNLEGCATIGFFNLIIDTVPIFQEVPLFQLCDDAVADGFTDFDLEIQTPIIQDGDTNLIVTYHLDPLDAEAGTIPSLSSPYTNIINPESVWVRVEDATTTCFGTFEMVLEVISVTGVVPDELFSCDEVPNDGFADFDLTVRDAQIINGQPNTFVTYYEDVVDADAGNTNFIALPTAFENTTIDTQIVFARLEETILGCYDVVELVLTVNAAPAITDPVEDYALCDNDEDLTEIFDLTSKYDEIVNILSDITLSYYNLESDADSETSPIQTPDNYSSTGAEVIWFRAVNLEGCATIGFFNLIIDTVPIFQEVPLFQLCDDAVADGFTDFDLEIQTPIIQDGDTNLIVTYHLDPLDAEAGTIPSLSSPYTNIINPESVWVRVEDATTTCFGTFEMVLEVIFVTGVVPDELFSCDEVPNDGFADFDLTVRDAQIINGQPNTFVTYYEDVVDADAGNTNFIALPTAFENTTIDTQIVFARLEETILGCYDVVELVLTVNAAPAITDPVEDYALCDNDEDLTEIFDLTSKYDEIVNILSDITLSYYNLESDADSETSPIQTPDNYSSTGAEVIWFRAVNLEGCATIGFFNLIIDTVPIFQEVPLFQLCDDAVADGFTDFDLEIQTPIIQDGDTNLIVTYHLDPLDAEAGTIPSLSSPYTNIINPESVWVRVEDATTTCFGTFEMELLVNPLPSPVTPTPLIECDLDNDGFIAFDLESKNTEILDGETGVIISYHETRPEAENGTNEQLSPYTNINNPIQTLFVRAEFTATGCYDIVPMDLIINPTPIIPINITDLAICDVNLDGIEFFDLTERANEIYGVSQDPTDYDLTYYTDPIDADLGDPIDAIVTPDAYPNTGNPETIWVRLENNLTGCYSVGSFIIDFIFCPQPDATIQIGNIGVFCASSNLDITYTVFNVNSTGPLPANTPIAFYADGILLGQSLTINEIPIDGSETLTISLFIPPGTPFIFTLKGVVDDDGTGTGIVGEDDETNNEFEITVDLDGERINLGPDIESCIGYTEVLDADLGAPGFNYQWFFDGALIPGATDPIFSATTNGTYSVTATDGVCFVEGDIVLNFNAPPIAVFPDVLVVCDAFPNDEFASFDLTERDVQISINDPVDTFVKYYLTEADADTATNPLGIPYTNVDPGTQTVFARLEGIPVGCYDVVPLVLQVDAAPAITDPIPDYFICDNDQDNNEIFDLTFWGNTEILNGLTNVDLSYYNNEPDAIADTSRIPVPNAYLSGGLETIWIRAENQEGCITISSFILISGDVPVIQPVSEFLVCDDDLLDGITQFDLDSQNATIAIGDPNLLVTYHRTPFDAEDGSNILTSPYTNIVNPETLYVRVIDISTGCFIVFDMELKVITPVAVVPDDLLACDEVPNDGFAEFNLRDRDDQIIDNQLNTFVEYYLTDADAEAGVNAIDPANAFINTTVDTQVLFARLEEPILGCFDVVELVLTVNAAPTITDPIEDYELCDNDEDLTEVFDLTSKYDEIVNTLADITLTYYNLETDANEEINAIAIPDAYTSAGAETIWFRAVNLDGCATIGFFNLIINIVPTYTEVPLYELCDDGISDGFTEFDLESQITFITNDDFNLTVTFYISQDDADTPINPLLSPYTNVTDPETIFVRVEDNTTGCYGSFEMILDIISPIAIQPDPLEYCDPDNDGFGEFTLTDADSQVTGGIPLGNLQVSYHYLLEDAQNGVNPLLSPYLNDVPFNQIVFVRLIDQTTGCYGTTTLELIVNPSPQIIQPSDLEQCDDDGDGVGEFDLTQSESDLLNGLDPLLYGITYYEDAGLTIPILNPTGYINIPPSPQTIHILVEDLDNGCTSETILLLWVYTPPVLIAPLPYELCDAITPDDEQESFDLESRTAEITGGDLTISVTYYETQAQADTGDPLDALTSPYLNTTNPQTIFLRAETTNGDNDLTCFVSLGVTLDLVVNPLPSPVTPTPLEVCDIDNDGLAEFILTDKDAEIIGGEPGVVVSYHETLFDAESGTLPLASPYANIDTFSQVVYVRAQYDEAQGGTGCFRVITLELKTTPTPIIDIDLPALVECADDEFTVFNLTDQAALIYGTQDPLDYTLTYYTDPADAEAGVNAIANPSAFTNTSNPQTIWVRLDDNTTDCSKVGSFNLVVELTPVFTVVPIFEQCDDQVQDGFTQFDLNSQNLDITGSDPTLGVTYYATQADADTVSNPLVIPYTNITNPETVFVRIESVVTGCYGTFTMDLVVTELPDIFQPDPLEFCDLDNDGFGEFTLTDADIQVTGGVPIGNLQVSYHYLLADALNDENPLVSPYLNDVPFNQTVFVRLLDQTTGCFTTTTLDLVVLDSPQIIQPSDLELCDDNGDGIEVFDLTLSEDELLNGLDPLLYSISYYQDAGLTIPITNPTAYSNIPPSPQTIYILVEDIANECKSETTLLLWVYPVPVLITPLPYELCDAITPDDEQEPFDLESITEQITGGDININVTYYQTQADADTGDPLDALTSPYLNTSNPQTIFVRGENVNTLCFVSLGVTLDLVVNPLPSPVTPTPLEVCDIDNDGLAEFILTDKDAEIIGGEPGVVVSYHETLFDAESGTLALASPYANIDPFSQVVYVRAQYDEAQGGTGCFRVITLELKTTPTPIIDIDLPALVECADGDFAVFNLTDQAVFIYGTQDPLDYTLTYYTLEADAEVGVNAIANPSAFNNTSNPQTIWVRLDDNTTDCSKVGSFELVVELIPAFTVVPIFEQCDDQDQDGFTQFDLNSQNLDITGSDPTLGVTYYSTQADADSGSNPLVIPYTNITNPETVFVRVESGVTGCYGTFTMDLVVVEAPTIIEPAPLEFCDPDNDGFGEFILSDVDLEITGGVPIGNLQVSYHYLLEDAQNGVLPLSIPYLNDVPFNQTVFVRLFDQTTGCYNITTLDLVVLESPQIIQPSDLVLCDDNGDGIEVFDLTLSESELLSTADPSGGPYIITYYQDVDLTFQIADPTAYSNIPPSPQTIYIVVEDIANECTSETILVLRVLEGPTLISPSALELCDVITPDDEQEPFDLDSKTDEITAGDLTIEVTYHETQADADSGANPISSPYLNTANPQTIFVRAEDLDTSCIASQGITLSLVVNPLPSPVAPTPLEVCDIDNEGFADFILTDKDLEIIGDEPGVVVSYYETQLDAEEGVFALTSPYTNIVSPSQIIYARAEYSLTLGGTGCFRVVELELIVNPTPIIPFDIADLVICDDDGDGFSIFDLTVQEDIIYGTQDPADYTLTYYISELDATDATNVIADPTAFANTTTPQTIWVRLENNSTTCIKIGSFDIVSELGPLVIQATPLTQCDDLGLPNDGVTLFDLTTKNDEITGGALGVRVNYYLTQADAELDVDVIDPDTAYQNTSNPQIIWVRVTDVNTLCVDTTTYLTLRVAANPEPEDPDPIILCDVNDPGDQVEVFDLTIRETQILDGETWDVSYYNSYQDAVDNNAAIALPTAYPNSINPEIVYVRVSIDLLDAAACFEIVELELIVNPIPDDSGIISPYIICEIPSDGEAVFDLSTKVDEILNEQDPSLFEVIFYESQAEASAMINAIQNPTTYSNLGNPQTIYVVILNSTTDCFVATQSFDIEVREGAVANTPLEPYAICDYYNENDGIAEFDLLNPDLLDEILGTQDPLVYQLDFYGTLENATLEVSPLPISYVNVINPQIIYARVTNIGTECYDITEVILKVELIPEVALDDFYRLCVDSLGNPIEAEDGVSSPPVIDTGLDPSIYLFEWQLNSEVLLGEIGASITVLAEGDYTVTVTEILTGCESSASTTVITSSPPLTYSAEVTDAFASAHAITATAEGIGEYVFQLDDNPFQESGLFLDVEPGNHLITIKDINGCGSVTISVGVIDYPQFMTPNQDGYHDTWNIIGIANGDPTAKIYIFDRYGKLLKQLSTLSEGWDGSYNGSPMPSSDYWFRVEYTENDTKKEFTGHFTLKR